MTALAPGAYLEGTTLLHRARPGAKLLCLFGFGVLVVAVPGWQFSLIALALALGIALWAGLRTAQLWRLLRVFLLVGAILFAFQAWQNSWQRGIEVVADLVALILAAASVTATTKTGDMLDTIIWSVRPLRRFGVSPERVGLTFSLAIRSLPLAFELAAQTREAARARGLDRSLRAFAIPLVIRTVAHARLTGEALHARGLGDD